MLDKFPPELCALIFDFACRDGRTGLALSHVSRYIRNTSELARYTSIALVGQAQIIAFAQFVEHTHLKLQTRYLFVNGQESKQELESIAYEAFAGMRKAERNMALLLTPDDEKLREAEEAIGREVTNARLLLGRDGASAVETILRALGPTLEILDIAVNEYVAMMLVNPVSLPHLVDLTTRCGFPLRPSDVPVLEPTHSLRYLHIVDSPHQWLRVEIFFGKGISYIAPSLTHLQLSRLHNNPVVVYYLGCALGHSENSEDSEDSDYVTQLPTTLERVVLKPIVELKHECGCESCTAYDDAMENYHNVVRRARRLRDTDDRVVLLKADSTRVEGFQEWLDKVEGAACVWDTKDLDLDSAETE
ncbi:hypothetical protein MSAN_01020800 [Mycena sanguinolenta]|uniref:Uncharacterized protein n=1 Tax=Mycena sanguinolenta TaxID=230812 RepID=A0A8H6YSQ0_9AGAR|nr:hypothetical protein MSAN_01020800 [Mycena sanguinolenta]